jgi:heat shock protein HtpX
MNHGRYRLRNRMHSLLLISGMVLLLAACGWIVGGFHGLIGIGIVGGFGVIAGAEVSGPLMLRLFGAEPLPRRQLAEIYAIVEALSRRAGLSRPPGLYYIASPTMTAFAVGKADSASIAITTGLLRRMSLRELTGVLAHELSHVRHNDIWVMGLADMISRMTRIMSMLGVLLLLFNLPLLVAGGEQVPWLLVILLMFAPTIGVLLQLALSRSREWDADLGSAELTGDPLALASALGKMERYKGRFWEDIFLPGRRDPEPSVLRSHPVTEERIRRLVELSQEIAPPDLPDGREAHHSMVPSSPPRPRWRKSGLWY